MMHGPYSERMLESIERTTLGVLPFASIVASLRYVPWVVTPGHGSHLAKDHTREAFISVEGSRRLHLGAFSFTAINGKQHGLVATPANPRLLIWSAGEHIGGFKVIPWDHVGLALVIRSAPPTYIGREWLAFVPIEEVQAAMLAVNPHAPKEAHQ